MSNDLEAGFYARLRKKARQEGPQVRPDCVLVGLFRETKPFASIDVNAVTEEDFIWVQARANTSVNRLTESTKAALEEYPEFQHGFKFCESASGEGALDYTRRMNEFNTYGDSMVILRAIPTGRPPLQETQSKDSLPASSRQGAVLSDENDENVPPVKVKTEPGTMPPTPIKKEPKAATEPPATIAQESNTLGLRGGLAQSASPQLPVTTEPSRTLPPPTPIEPAIPPSLPPLTPRNSISNNTVLPPIATLPEQPSIAPPTPRSSISHTTPSHIWSPPPAVPSATSEPCIPPGSTSPTIPRHHNASAPSANTPGSDALVTRGNAGRERIANPLPPPSRPVPTNLQLQDLFGDAPVECMETGISKGLHLLDRLQRAVSTVPGPDAQAWLKRIEDVRKLAERQPTVVGVVGNTGAGKSSVINALLDEERLVPTNCMRACTAVVTEISYNNETDDKYRAKVEFISREEWLKELKVLFEDITQESGGMRRAAGGDSEAGIALDKIRAVYPLMTIEMIENSTPETLIKHPAVNRFLGTTKLITNNDSMAFYRELQKYVDSKEKTGKLNKGDKRPPKEMEFWPLIRVVKIQVKSEVLKTGAVVVDLPGVHDANQARAAVADGYMKKCTGLWVVAPITRAVDDKSAQKLLGQGFKRQLLMDGGYNSLTFICSKSDDISISEAVLSLGLDEDLGPELDEIDRLDGEIKQKKQALRDKKEEFDAAKAEIDAFDDQLTVWEELQEKVENGDKAYPPKPKKEKKKKETPKKRKRGDEKDRTKAKKRKSYGGDDDDFIVDDDEPIEVEDSNSDESNEDPDYNDNSDEEDADKEGSDAEEEDLEEPLTLEQCEEKVAEYKQAKKDARTKKMELNREVSDLKGEIADLENTRRKLENQIACACIDARNEYSSGAIQVDFANGLQELDREAGEELDGENFDPSVPVRDYDAIAKSLPVFCVSSRGYQKVKGRLRKDGDKTVFQNAEQTGMPQLQAHCSKMTEKGRLAGGRRFLTALSQLVNSMAMWSADNDSALAMSAEQRERERKQLEQWFRNLDKSMEDTVRKTTDAMKEELNASIYDRYEDAINAACEAAIPTADRWGLPVNRENPDEGGYYWSVYKAIVRRNGEYSNYIGHHSMNTQLTAPILRVLSTHWERVFTRHLPNTLKSLPLHLTQELQSFHARILTTPTAQRSPHISLISHQLQTISHAFTHLTNHLLADLNDKQRDINRSFVENVMKDMAPIYAHTAAEVGMGQFRRMKIAMHDYVDRHKAAMFRASVERVRRLLDDALKLLRRKMEEQVWDVVEALKTDYKAVFRAGEHEVMKEMVLVLRERMKTCLEGVREWFEAVREGREVAVEGWEMRWRAEDAKLPPVVEREAAGGVKREDEDADEQMEDGDDGPDTGEEENPFSEEEDSDHY